MKWLLFVYKVPSDSSTARVTIWRKVKRIGALYLQQSVCIVPYMEKFLKEVEDLEKEVKGFGGDFKSFEVVALGEEIEKDLIEQFNKQRREEYNEVIEQCEEFFKEIEKEINRENFTFAELEENEDELNKLYRWFKKVTERDVFNCEMKRKAEELLKKASEEFEKFSKIVYEKNREEDFNA
ncbi:Chromate resistance protein ChrB [Caldanaerobacter sp.]|uniref:Chromate resistance protein ChrB n=1 Tax=Caldanaerobacter sp. TaxID=2930036 RepID=UPI003C70F9C9